MSVCMSVSNSKHMHENIHVYLHFITPGKLRVCAGNYFYDYLMVFLWFRCFPVYDFDTVLVTISIRLRGKARLGNQS